MPFGQKGSQFRQMTRRPRGQFHGGGQCVQPVGEVGQERVGVVVLGFHHRPQLVVGAPAGQRRVPRTHCEPAGVFSDQKDDLGVERTLAGGQAVQIAAAGHAHIDRVVQPLGRITDHRSAGTKATGDGYGDLLQEGKINCETEEERFVQRLLITAFAPLSQQRDGRCEPGVLCRAHGFVSRMRRPSAVRVWQLSRTAKSPSCAAREPSWGMRVPMSESPSSPVLK